MFQKHIVKLNHKTVDWVGITQGFEGTPYLWGGRDSKGLDCSALLQLSCQTNGFNLPRNTTDQKLWSKKIITEVNSLKRGCVVFWEGHVGIMVDKDNCIHANAYHMKVYTEPLNKIIKRMHKCKIIRMANFN